MLLAVITGLLACESVNYVPLITQQADAAKKGRYVDVATLSKGRALLVHRCIGCHTLPPLWHYRVEDWPEIVDSMSHRANLNAVERDAVVAYIVALRTSGE